MSLGSSRKKVFLGVALLAGSSVLFFTCSYSRKLLEVVSPDQNHELVFSYRPFALTPETKNVYLSIKSGTRVVADRHMIYLGDILDVSFSEAYPEWKWIENSTFALSDFGNEPQDKVTIENKTSKTIDYLIVETSGEKFILLNVVPSQIRVFKFNYREHLSMEGQIQSTESKVFGAVKAISPGRPNEFNAIIESNSVEINLINGQTKPTKCCGWDRPGI